MVELYNNEPNKLDKHFRQIKLRNCIEANKLIGDVKHDKERYRMLRVIHDMNNHKTCKVNKEITILGYIRAQNGSITMPKIYQYNKVKAISIQFKNDHFSAFIASRINAEIHKLAKIIPGQLINLRDIRLSRIHNEIHQHHHKKQLKHDFTKFANQCMSNLIPRLMRYGLSNAQIEHYLVLRNKSPTVKYKTAHNILEYNCNFSENFEIRTNEFKVDYNHSLTLRENFEREFGNGYDYDDYRYRMHDFINLLRTNSVETNSSDDIFIDHIASVNAQKEKNEIMCRNIEEFMSINCSNNVDDYKKLKAKKKRECLAILEKIVQRQLTNSHQQDHSIEQEQYLDTTLYKFTLMFFSIYFDINLQAKKRQLIDYGVPMNVAFTLDRKLNFGMYNSLDRFRNYQYTQENHYKQTKKYNDNLSPKIIKQFQQKAAQVIKNLCKECKKSLHIEEFDINAELCITCKKLYSSYYDSYYDSSEDECRDGYKYEYKDDCDCRWHYSDQYDRDQYDRDQYDRDEYGNYGYYQYCCNGQGD